MPAAKHFAPKRDAKPAPTVEFSIAFVRDGVEEIHEFAARPRPSAGDIIGVIEHQDNTNGRVVPYFARMIRRALRNDDGTPEKWRPVIHEGHFNDPAGNRTPVAELPKFLTFEAGSSRRRWVHLMEYDDDITVEIELLDEVFQYLMEEAAGRPT